MVSRRAVQLEYGDAMRGFMATAVLFQDAVARAAGLNATDLQALGLLVTEGPLAPGELAERTGITSGGAITLLIDRLEAAGFVSRTRDTQDRRRVQVVADLEQVDARITPLYADVARAWDGYLATVPVAELGLGIAQLRAATEITRDQLQQLRRSR